MTGSLLAAFKRNVIAVMVFLQETMTGFVRLREKNALDTADKIRHGVTTRIESCTTCGTHLPLRLPRTGEQGINWQCTACGYRYYGVLDEDASEDTIENVRKAGHVKHSRRGAGKGSVTRSGQMMGSAPPQQEAVDEESNRHPFDSTILATLLDSDQKPQGSPFLVRTKNISATGIAMQHANSFDPGSLLQVELLDAKCEVVTVVVRVLRCTAVGGYHEIAGAFLEPIDLLVSQP
jgi:predicted RNA-binding Zn-ribbon protein involved in translation (DUF1610 family)